ncbi:MAG TPA: DUF4175 family protein [Gracilimonas sp.]|uniref:DUF4175 family protein n=1 Tax=Gracilimonas sp. TaxID=1974203 RepID=UPI002D9EC656|nr:DUF4175 family protein [Gracilimonas sp.]
MEKTGPHNSTDKVQKLLHSAFDTLLSKRSGTILLRSFLILFAGFTALIIAENVIYLSIVTKTTLLFSILIASITSYRMGKKASKSLEFTEFYREFSRKSKLPELKDTLDLEKSGGGNRALIDAAVLQNLSKIKTDRLENSLSEYLRSSESYSHYKQFLNLGVAAFIILGITSFNFNNAAQRTFTFWKGYEKPNPFSFTISPGDITLEQGTPFKVDIAFKGELIPENTVLRIKTSVEEEYRTRVMEHSGTIFSSIPQKLNNDLEYYIEMDGYKSEIFSANVQLRPRFTQLQAAIIPPVYTELDSSMISYPVSQIRAYQGSILKLSGELNKEISSLQLYSGNEFLDLPTNQDSTFTYDLEIEDADTLRFYIEDKKGLTNKNPFQIIVSPQPDEYPLAEIIEPEQNLQEVNPEEINLLYRATDDFGLTAAALSYELRRAYTEEPVTGTISLNTPSIGSLNSYVWNLNELNLKPLDVLTFSITVQDNDEYNGYKSSSSQSIILEVPSLVDYFEDIDQKEDEIETDLTDISKAFEQTQEQYERFKEQMKNDPESTGYEEKRELEQVQKQQEEVQKRIEELNQKFKELKDELNKDDMLSEETQKAYDELQKLMEEIDDPAYREALRKLQEQMAQMSPEQMREAMENLEFNEELYKERLQRTIELFKQIKLNSDLDKLVKSFEDMARKEEEQAQSDQNQPTELIDEQQKRSLEEIEKLKEQVNSLSENTTENNQQAVNEYQQNTNEELDRLSEETKEDNESASEAEKQESESDSADKNNSEEQEGNRQQRYQKLAEDTQKLMDSIYQNQMNINIAGLRYVLYSLLNLSLEQEDLTTLASSTENRSQAYVTYARDQSNVEGIFTSISDSLFQLSSQIPQFSNDINKKKLEVKERLQRSLEQMSERNRSQSSVASRQALGGINEISFMVANLLEQLQNSEGEGGGGAGGMSMQQMIEQLQQSGEQQQQLNQMMQEMINDIQGDRLSQDQMERLDQIARQQNQIRKQLQELQQNGDFSGDKIGSELERMIEDMEDTINDLRGGATDPILIERQQNILSRMLDAEQAMQERDEEDKREGSIAEDLNRSTPPELTLEELEKQIQNRLNDPNFTKYSPDYQRLIENYFELLKRLQEREIQ